MFSSCFSFAFFLAMRKSNSKIRSMDQMQCVLCKPNSTIFFCFFFYFNFKSLIFLYTWCKFHNSFDTFTIEFSEFFLSRFFLKKKTCLFRYSFLWFCFFAFRFVPFEIWSNQRIEKYEKMLLCHFCCRKRKSACVSNRNWTNKE